MVAKQSVKPLLVIVGETASGKSKLAMQLAKNFDGEIIAADSWTVYKDFNVGTAKPTTKDRAQIPHHLIDITTPQEGFSAALFQKLTYKAIDGIHARGKLPILVGGTGLYIDSIFYAYSFMPAPSAELRDELNSLNLSQLIDKVERMNFSTEGIDLGNKRRLIRLIENNGQRPSHGEQRPNTLIIGLKVSQTQLHTRIIKRVDNMLKSGLEQEAGLLAKRYGWDTEPMKGIGYREFYEYFEGCQSLSQTREKVINNTLALAKKQQTWFKRNKSIQWIDKQIEAVDLITTLLNK